MTLVHFWSDDKNTPCCRPVFGGSAACVLLALVNPDGYEVSSVVPVDALLREMLCAEDYSNSGYESLGSDAPYCATFTTDESVEVTISRIGEDILMWWRQNDLGIGVSVDLDSIFDRIEAATGHPVHVLRDTKGPLT